ncbi:hypothetical protein LEN26_004583 [Aphanomyces euteiches]|nr:hypothetical protein LEN26_004582 [Aphanomyces euteiches]KAH9148165.1 hypothetical protein LEN26_004583 [Aphanomyces euteiches]
MSVVDGSIAESYSTEYLPRTNPAVRNINSAVDKIDLRKVEQSLEAEDRSPLDPDVFVCNATLEAWNLYVESEYQALMSRAMEWNDNKIYIVELPSRLHGNVASMIDLAIMRATGTFHDHLCPRRSSYVADRRLIEPDCSFGPTRYLPGAVVPANMEWCDFDTIKVEIGVSRMWPALDRKARDWATFPGVQYILCIYITPATNIRQYKLHDVINGALANPNMVAINIVNPTDIVLNSHRLLGLPQDHDLPDGFQGPDLTINLFGIVQYAVQEAA